MCAVEVNRSYSSSSELNMASRSPTSSPRHDRSRNGTKAKENGKGHSFFKLGEVRVATDKDFEYFMRIADNHDGWVKKMEKNGLRIWQKETESSLIKMAKVAYVHVLSRSS